jgi:hypothetical protein
VSTLCGWGEQAGWLGLAFLALSILPRQDNGGPIYGVGLPGVGHVYGGANNIPLRGGKLSDWEVIIRTLPRIFSTLFRTRRKQSRCVLKLTGV